MGKKVNVIGAGLAGCEAAYQLAKRGINVTLYEMKPEKSSPAHHSNDFAELVCSNSLRSAQLENAVGLLKEELRTMDSLIMRAADETRVPAGGALAVDREGFSQYITKEIKENSNIEIVNKEMDTVPDENITIIATGPLTSEPMFNYIKGITGEEYLHFFDAAAPIVTFDSINMNKAFRAARYGKGSEDYINCPMNREEYEVFYDALINAEAAEVKDFEKNMVFEGCMPIESMAYRGKDTMRFGPLKPVGLVDERTNVKSYAVVQLRQDNKNATLYNIVGFQTHLKWPEQKRVFSLIPGLENAEFVRYGVMHRNTYINSPKLLDNTYRLKNNENMYFAGQITGVEGYIESTSSGFVAGINAAAQCRGGERIVFPPNTAIGALSNYISDGSIRNFQPMNVNFGIFSGIDEMIVSIRDKKKRNMEIAKNSVNFVKKVEL
ncbi:gid protein [Ruminiclostridium papyrosolvens DSM 2782]|uniref:Methylenetetrahydrofolate--tRNA-(uracil-5-)-methyltransferase TrmFO n=1 Tax=Ruminiclostridium papyrosolvens DSM 2782 TaxID=588581 RepID=F1THQ5_9FIRM|nr:methylenetetrahydrofolate--tRNA-(uracil(54)-C(5))-methyltransferase (FADH(2)-oxidizing) TrmFO [Ruminiclostridium papyrosolvens]EGD46037.1 gid protein [Ruminiclostridium papyrosolvens DSM 2782]WES32837.1 methylenetetrahydrofolate--tRNA-(uracil(54)-C(5))-methyltransferase (FADH(2)-oxidizing) TrmFO [Ruminiclostridium papyrosolvens DSM 2782]